MRPLRRSREILTALTILATAFSAGCEKKSPAPPAPAATPAPAASKTLQLPRFLGLSLNGQPVEQIAAAFQDPQSLEVQDLQKTFGIQDTAYLDRVMTLIESQLQSGSPMKWIGIYFGGAPKNLSSHCMKESGGGVCLIEPYAFNCSEAISQKNWNEENFLKLCRRLGRLKAYKADRLVALVSGEAALGFEETSTAPSSSTTEKSGAEKKSVAISPKAPLPTPEATSSLSVTVSRRPYPEMIDLLQYLQREGVLIGFLSDQDGAASLGMLASLGINLPADRIAGRDLSAESLPEKRTLQALRLARRYVEARNRLAPKPEDQINLEDLRLILVAGADFAPSNGPSVGDGINYLENLSTVPGGADFLFLHRHVLEADQKLSRKKSSLENFQFFNAQARALHPLRVGLSLIQAVLAEMKSPGGKGGFLTQDPGAAPESQPSESRPSEAPTAESKASATPIPRPAESKPSELLQIPPAPPADPKKDAL